MYGVTPGEWRASFILKPATIVFFAVFYIFFRLVGIMNKDPGLLKLGGSLLKPWFNQWAYFLLILPHSMR